MMPAGAAAAVGGVAGLTWAAGFREYMASLFGKESKVTWYGTFGTILLPAVAIGALYGWAEHRRANGENLPLRRTIAAAPIAIGVLPLTRPGAVATLRKTGEGSAASGVDRSPMRIPVSSSTSRTQVSVSDSSGRSFEPVTLCQYPGASARSSSRTSSAGVWMTTRTDSGTLKRRERGIPGLAQVAPCVST